jgi:hypothetical protein
VPVGVIEILLQPFSDESCPVLLTNVQIGDPTFRFNLNPNTGSYPRKVSVFATSWRALRSSRLTAEMKIAGRGDNATITYPLPGARARVN